MIPKPKKKVSKTYLKNKADRLFAIHIKNLAMWQCALLGLDTIHCSTIMNCAHIIGRGNKRLAYDLQNALCICNGHHVWYTNNPERWRDLMKKHFNSRWVYLKKHEMEKVKVNYYEVIEQYK